MLENLISAIAEQYKIEGLRMNENGVCKMLVEGRLEIYIEDAPMDQRAHMYCMIARAPESQVQAFYETLLGAQLFGREMGMGCCFGLSKETGELFLNRTIRPEGMSEEDFVEALSEFINWADHWSLKLGEAGSSPQAVEPSSEVHEVSDPLRIFAIRA